jgi:2-keto-4-pentenoate hydratase/2-oxohepta-3-ene-1,7-dioic acid hydratase in catechol pathway
MSEVQMCGKIPEFAKINSEMHNIPSGLFCSWFCGAQNHLTSLRERQRMKYCRFEFEGLPQFGMVENAAGQKRVGRVSTLPPQNGDFVGWRQIPPLAFEDLSLLTPVQPSKIVCIGRNYREHAAELGNQVPQEPLLFLKPPSSLLDPGARIFLPRISNRVDFEGELGVVIGKRARNIRPDEDFRQYILGYTCVNDVTARDLQKKDVQFTRGKGFDTFCPTGPVVSDEIDPWAGVAVQTRVNGELRQDGNTRDFIFALDTVIRHIAEVMTLLPGDLIATGTPSGVGPLKAGDVVEVTIPGIGVLQNSVVQQE